MNHYVLVVLISANGYTMATSEKYESVKNLINLNCEKLP